MVYLEIQMQTGGENIEEGDPPKKQEEEKYQLMPPQCLMSMWPGVM